MEYRREIDGLRAVAVVPVVLFHAGFSLFAGGFVGVDVFFVISGYLITSIILAEAKAGHFSIVRFYERRARRIVPALFLVLAVCVPFAWAWLLPPDLKGFSESLIAVPLFLSNVLFWRQSGYFEGAAELKPLLHTWSLAVEEQFYVLFPLLLVVGLRFGKRVVAGALLFALVASLAIAELGSLSRPAATFFLLPTRAWELATGALLAIWSASSAWREPPRPVKEVLGLLGAALILYGVFAYGKDTPFPGLYALAPTVGTALIIAFTTPDTVLGRLLGTRTMVGIGLISYGAYLWHQPLFAFARHRSPEEPNALMLLVLAVAAFVLAYFSWKFVERPVRSKGRISRGAVFAGTGVLSLAFIAAGAAGVMTDGGAERLSRDERELLALADYKTAMVPFRLRTCFIDYDQGYPVLAQNGCFAPETTKRRVVVFGDSEAAHLSGGIRRAFAGEQFQVDQWTATSCRPADFPDQGDRCRAFYRYFADELVPRLKKDDILIVAGNWGDTEQRIGQRRFQQDLEGSLDRLRRSGARIVLVGDAPDFRRNPIEQVVRRGEVGQPEVYLHAVDHTATNARIRELARSRGATFFDPGVRMCKPDGSCLAYMRGAPLFSDTNHFSAQGSDLVIGHLLRQLRDDQLLLAP